MTLDDDRIVARALELAGMVRAKMSDGEIASALHVCDRYVHGARAVLGIPPAYLTRRGHPPDVKADLLIAVLSGAMTTPDAAAAYNIPYGTAAKWVHQAKVQ